MKCFHHIDDDGKCAGYWVNYYTKDKKEEREFIAIDYGIRFPIEKILPDEEVYIVDFSLDPKDMNQLLEITKNVIWIDHHKTAIEKYKDYPFDIKGIRYDGIAGCMLTWLYFQGVMPPCKNKIEEAPTFTRLIADYDVWTFYYGDRTKYFHIGLGALELTPFSKEWDLMREDGLVVNQIITTGMEIEKYKDNCAKTYCDVLGFETEFEGYRAYALNKGLCGSDDFKSVDGSKYDLFIGFVYDGLQWKYSLRSEKIDVSEIAKKYGGGGHKGAAGFKSDSLLLMR